MSFKEWLCTELIEEGVVDEDIDPDELSTQMLLEDTELDEEDIENYKQQFAEHCENLDKEPSWDLD